MAAREFPYVPSPNLRVGREFPPFLPQNLQPCSDGAEEEESNDYDGGSQLLHFGTELKRKEELGMDSLDSSV